MLDSIVIQMRKTNSEKGYCNEFDFLLAMGFNGNRNE